MIAHLSGRRQSENEFRTRCQGHNASAAAAPSAPVYPLGFIPVSGLPADPAERRMSERRESRALTSESSNALDTFDFVSDGGGVGPGAPDVFEESAGGLSGVDREAGGVVWLPGKPPGGGVPSRPPAGFAGCRN